jgi:hypothetical protein
VEQPRHIPQHSMEHRQESNVDARHQQRFMEDWQTIQRQQGKLHAPWGKQQGMSNDNRTGANIGAADNGWPIRPVQTTLETYFQNPSQTQPRVRWGDQDEGVGFRPLPVNSTNREPLPLEYADA